MGVRQISTFVKYLTSKIKNSSCLISRQLFIFLQNFTPTYYIEGGVIFCQDLVR